MKNFRNKVIEVEGRLFQVKRRFPEGRINLEKGSPNDLKQYYHCDIIFKADNYLWICNEIKEISYEEIRD